MDKVIDPSPAQITVRTCPERDVIIAIHNQSTGYAYNLKIELTLEQAIELANYIKTLTDELMVERVLGE